MAANTSLASSESTATPKRSLKTSKSLPATASPTRVIENEATPTKKKSRLKKSKSTRIKPTSVASPDVGGGVEATPCADAGDLGGATAAESELDVQSVSMSARVHKRIRSTDRKLNEMFGEEPGQDKRAFTNASFVVTIGKYSPALSRGISALRSRYAASARVRVFIHAVVLAKLVLTMVFIRSIVGKTNTVASAKSSFMSSLPNIGHSTRKHVEELHIDDLLDPDAIDPSLILEEQIKQVASAKATGGARDANSPDAVKKLERDIENEMFWEEDLEMWPKEQDDVISPALGLCKQEPRWSLKSMFKKCHGIEEAKKRFEAGSPIHLPPKSRRDENLLADDKCICRALIEGVPKCDPNHPSYLTRCKDQEAHQRACQLYERRELYRQYDRPELPAEYGTFATQYQCSLP
mmetsp:Transcript_6280/g.23153  ORF Transcript_6280/g.23153 Transcript_6280/m.23153 type:complete len:409 (+) Transcript_6280:79-1305(+)